MKLRSKLILYVAAATFAIGIAFAPLPWKTTQKDQKKAISHAITTLLKNRKVSTDDGRQLLLDTRRVSANDRIYFINETGISDEIFLTRGLMPIPDDRELDVDAGDVVVGFSDHNAYGEKTNSIQFSYTFGSLGAHGYEIKIRKSLLIRSFKYIHSWVS